jgi:hypothetical protein
MLGDCAWSSRLIAKTGKAAEAQDLEEALDKARYEDEANGWSITLYLTLVW